MKVRQWSRDLGLGMRFAWSGGREGWVRMLLTAVGVGLGVALLLLTTALPNALSVRHQRDEARLDYTYGPSRPKAVNTLVISDVNTSYRGQGRPRPAGGTGGPARPDGPGTGPVPGSG